MGLPDTKTNLDAIGRDISADVPASNLVVRLKALEPDCAEGPLRAPFLAYRGIVLNRLGLPGDALGDLHEARALFADLQDGTHAAAACREIARVHAWRGEGRDAALALLQAFAIGGTSDAENMALATLESGRLHLEIGRHADARVFLQRAIDAAAGALPASERLRAHTLLVQALVVLGQLDAASAAIATIDPQQATDRVRHLIAIETARIAARRGDVTAAQAGLDALKAKPPAVGSFEAVEIDELDADIAARAGRTDQALAQIRTAIGRFAEDDLAGREVLARLSEADILTTSGRAEDAGRTLLAALHRAVGRGLNGYADMVRAELGKRSLSVLAWAPGSMPSEATRSDNARYVRRRPLGEGGFGSVSSAYDLETGEEVALKRLRLSEIYDMRTRTGRLDSARREAAAASRLQHPGIGRVYGLIVGEDGDGLLVRELITGPTLREALAQTLPTEVKLAILTEFAQAVAAIHAAGIVHRDLKPENIVLKSGRHPVVIDFGASTVGTKDKGGGFSALYAAPEQVVGRPVDKRADLFAFGMIVAEVLLGRRWERATRGPIGAFRYWRATRRLVAALTGAGCPTAAARLVALALSLNPAARPGDINPLVSALQAPDATRR